MWVVVVGFVTVVLLVVGEIVTMGSVGVDVVGQWRTIVLVVGC